MKVKKIIYIIALVILLTVFAVSAVYVIGYFVEGAKQKAEYDELAGIVESIQQETHPEESSTGSTEDSSAESTESSQPTGAILPEYAPLYEMNSDLVGWIRIEGTNVNYPVMQTPDNRDFYLYRNFKKEYSARGCIYVRETCDVNAPSDNLTIYGHNMNDGSMFHNLRYYDAKEYYEAHPIIVFDTLTEQHTYQIFAVFKTTATVGKGFDYHHFEDAATQADFDDFVKQCKALSFFETGHTPSYGDKLICLSTCEYTQENGRLVVAAYRIS